MNVWKEGIEKYMSVCGQQLGVASSFQYVELNVQSTREWKREKKIKGMQTSEAIDKCFIRSTDNES